jgi:hypothetical protein
LCDQQRGIIFLFSIRDNVVFENVPVIVKRSDGVWDHPDFEIFKQLPYNNKFGVILGDRFEYEAHFRPDWRIPGKNSNGNWWPSSFQIMFQAEQKGLMSPVLSFPGMGQNCRIWSEPKVNPWKRVDSLESLRAQKINSYYSKGSEFFIRLKSTEPIDTSPSPSEFIKMSRAKYAMVQCDTE